MRISQSQIDLTSRESVYIKGLPEHADFLDRHASPPPSDEEFLKKHSGFCTSHLTYVMATIHWTAVKGTAVSSLVLRVEEAVCQDKLRQLHRFVEHSYESWHSLTS